MNRAVGALLFRIFGLVLRSYWPHPSPPHLDFLLAQKAFPHLPISMANDTPQNDTPQNLTYTPIGVQGVVEVSAHLVGNSLIDSLRRIFTTNSQIEQGDFLMDRSLDLLERHHRLMVRKDQKVVRHSYMKSVFNVLCCAAESLKCDTPTH